MCVCVAKTSRNSHKHTTSSRWRKCRPPGACHVLGRLFTNLIRRLSPLTICPNKRLDNSFRMARFGQQSAAATVTVVRAWTSRPTCVFTANNVRARVCVCAPRECTSQSNALYVRVTIEMRDAICVGRGGQRAQSHRIVCIECAYTHDQCIAIGPTHSGTQHSPPTPPQSRFLCAQMSANYDQYSRARVLYACTSILRMCVRGRTKTHRYFVQCQALLGREACGEVDPGGAPSGCE